MIHFPCKITSRCKKILRNTNCLAFLQLNEDKTLNEEKFRENLKSPDFKGNIDNMISKCLDINKLNIGELFVLSIIIMLYTILCLKKS